jgi:type VI secretion system protein ImpM
MTANGIPGFFGKLPCRADFLKQRLPATFIGVWDAWVRQVYLGTDDKAGDQAWVDRYLVSPLWRFYWSAGVCGDSVWLGAFMPSVDSVGRCYPMVVAADLPNAINPFEVIAGARPWYRSIEEIMVSALEEDADPADFDQLVKHQQLQVPAQASVPRVEAHGSGWSFAMPCEGPEQAWFFAVVARVAHDAHSGYTLWWVDHSTVAGSNGLFYLGLPPAGDATFFLAPAAEI